MKNAMSNNVRSKPIQSATHKNRPEIRDDMDSRANEEQDFKGKDVTHNKKDVHSKGKSEKKNSL